MAYIGAPAFDHAADIALQISQKVPQTTYDSKMGSFVAITAGDVRMTSRTLAEPAWVLCDGVARLRTSYPTLAANVGYAIPFIMCEKPTGVVPASAVYGIAMSNDGVYVVASEGSSPYVNFFKRTGDTLTTLTRPTWSSATYSTGLSFSTDATYLSVATSTSPYFAIFKRTVDTFAAITFPAAGSIGTAASSAFSPDDAHVAFGHSLTPFVSIYKRTGDTFAKLSNPATLPTGSVQTVEYSADGVYLCVMHTTAPYMTIYKRSGDTYTKLANPAILPPDTGYSASFSPDGTYLAVSFAASPYLYMYKRSGDVFTKVSENDAPAIARGTSVQSSLNFSPDGTNLVMTGFAPHVHTFKRIGDTITYVKPPAAVLPPTNSGTYGCVFSQDGKYMITAFAAAPWMQMFVGLTSDMFAPPKIDGVNGQKFYIKA